MTTAPDPLDLLALSRRIIASGDVTRAEALALFTLEGEDVYDLLYAAHKVRRHFHGNRVTFCSILPTKFGNCSEDCKFCAQSGHYDTGITPHTMMDADEVAKACADSRDKGASAFGIVKSVEDRVRVAFSLKELNPNVVPLNFLFPIPGTPLEDAPRLRPLEILKIVAAMRLILPRQDLKVAGGREKNLRDLQSWIFYAGATSALIGNYLATYGRPHHEDLQMIEDLELSWHEDRVGDADPSVPPPPDDRPASPLWELPILS